ncbi:MAG TPA: Do family serine endopeptidase [Stellaceae bacterium]|nr:Do family serine endopeptidase [Stellaceae bacterium]
MAGFGRRGALVAASLALLPAPAAPVVAQRPQTAASSQIQASPAPKPPPGAAAPTNPAAGPSRAAAAANAGTNPPAATTPFAELFAKLAGRVVGTVVNISTVAAAPTGKPAAHPQQNSAGTTLDQVFRDFFGENGGPGAAGEQIASLGSGFIIDPSGLIVTNNHVIANAEHITVTLADNTSLQARVVGRDAITDLALLKVDPKEPLPAARWGDSNKAQVGDWVLTIGNPFGLGGTVTAGIISATARVIHSSPYDDYLQTDASINRGNSGGPMFNLAGQVIGINTVIYSPSGGSIGIGFALPSAIARPIIEQLERSGRVERGWIGTRIQPMNADLAESVGLDRSRGAMIAAVDADSPAAGAKLEPGDVILAYDGQAIDRSRELPRLVAATPPGRQVTLAIWRDGKERAVALKVAMLDPDRKPPPPPPPAQPKPPVAVEAFGLKLAKITPELRKEFALPDWANGVVITEVPRDGPAAAQDLQPGDLLIAIGRTPIASPRQVPAFAAAATKAKQKMVLVRIEGRRGGTRFVALPAAAE